MTSSSQQANVRQLVQKAWDMVQYDHKRSITLAEAARDQAIVQHDKQSLADSLSIMSRGMYRTGAYESSLENGLEALSLYRENEKSDIFVDLLNTLGALYFRFGDYPEALRYYQQQEYVSNTRQDTYNQARARDGQAAVYSETGEYERALKDQEMTRQLFTELGNTRRIIISYNNICYTLWELGRDEDAVEAGMKGLALCEEVPNLTRLRAWLMTSLCLPLQRLGRFAEADALYEEALQSAEKREDPQMLSHLAAIRGRYYAAQSDYVRAVAHLNQAIELSEAIGTRKRTLSIHEMLIEIYREQGDSDATMQHYDQVIGLRKAMFNESVLLKMRHLEIAHRTELSRKKAELAEAHSAELERLVAKRTKQLQAALHNGEILRDKLRVALNQELLINAQRANFIKTVTHAFRTPMTVIKVSSDLLRKHYERLTPAKREAHFEYIKNSINQLASMLDDAITAETHAAGQVQVGSVQYEFAPLFLRLERELRAELVNSSNLTFVFDRTDHQMIYCDAALIQQLLFILLSNAVKFCPVKPIEARMKCDGTTLTIQVIDQGVGIPPGAINQLFELFSRANNVENERGLGLGLYIAKQIVDALSGEILAESSGVNQGSTFTVRLPSSLVSP